MIHTGIDITALLYNRGVSRYTSNLVRALASEKNIKLSLFGYSLRNHQKLSQECRALTSKNAASFEKLILKRWPPSLTARFWQWNLNPVGKYLPNVNLFHSWDWIQPPDKKLALVSTIHDLAILKYPETAHPQVAQMHTEAWKVLKDRQAHIIAVSRSTKKDIVELLGFPSHRVHVTYQALTQELFQLSQSMSEDRANWLKQKLQLDKPFILFVGTREPRKNLERAIKAWKPLAKEVELVIAGAPGWDGTQQTRPLTGLRFLGPVTDEELVVLYSEASLFLYPSLYEGFGLPILEAFHFGTPVVTSNTSSLTEVAGNAAVLVEPESVESITEGIKTLLNESITEQKKRLQQMIIRLQMFNWQTTAKETIKVYQQALVERT